MWLSVLVVIGLQKDDRDTPEVTIFVPLPQTEGFHRRTRVGCMVAEGQGMIVDGDAVMSITRTLRERLVTWISGPGVVHIAVSRPRSIILSHFSGSPIAANPDNPVFGKPIGNRDGYPVVPFSVSLLLSICAGYQDGTLENGRDEQ